MKELTHFNEAGKAIMVDVGDKESTRRVAVARGEIRMHPDTLGRILDKRIAKGDVLDVARLAGIMAAKKTPELIPLCHPIGLDQVSIEFVCQEATITIRATAQCQARTGAEMEALTAASIAALTIYDMCKAVDRGRVITDIMLVEKKGGKSGHWQREETP